MLNKCSYVFAVIGATVLLGLCVPVGRAATIRLKNHTTVQGHVLGVDDDRVVIGLPRADILTVDGASLPPALTVGIAAPPFSMRDIQGMSQAIGKDQGALTVLHFWISWCPHCRSDAPKMQALYDKFREHPHVRVLTVSLDEQRAPIDRFIQTHHVTYPIIHASEQAAIPGQVNLAELYQITGFPVTYLIDAQGMIRQKFSGSFTEAGKDLEQLITILLSTREEKPRPS